MQKISFENIYRRKILHYLFIFDLEALIDQLMDCFLGCFDRELNCCVVLAN